MPRPWVPVLTALAAVLFMVCSLSLLSPVAAAGPDIVYDQDGDGATIATANATIDISRLYPAAMIRASNDVSGGGCGFLVSALIGYNATDMLDNPQTEARYYASMADAIWESIGPFEEDGEAGSTVTFAIRSTVDIAERIPGSGSGVGGSGQTGFTLIEDWAEVQFTYKVTSKNYMASYPGFSDYSIQINGSTEIKAYVTIELNKRIQADRLAIDFGLCLMNAENLALEPSDEPYNFYGYQADGVSTIDPTVNETDGSAATVHEFQYRNTNEQMFAFVEDGAATGYFEWADKVKLNRSDGDSALVTTSTSYCTDGECLRVYLESPVTTDATSISLDPSLGVFPAAISEGGGGGGGIVRPLPEDGGLFGSSAMSFYAGVLIGGAVIGGGAGVLYVHRRGWSEDPLETVSLEMNRYYKGERRH